MAILRDAERAGATFAEVLDLDTGTLYCATIGGFWSHGGPMNRGYGVQQFLPLRCWRISRPDAPRQLELSLSD